MECLGFKEGVEVNFFDNNSNSCSYLLSYKGRHWKVAPFVAYVYEALSETENADEAYRLISDNSKVDVPVEKFDEVIGFFRNNGLFVGTDDVEAIKKSKELWGKITVIPAKVVNKFKWLGVLFRKRIMTVIAVMELICFAYFFATYDSGTIISDLWSLNVERLCICILIIMLFGLMHEFGHSAALMGHGQEAGAIGMGVYLYMPVFYSNVTNAWKLKRLQRVCVDAGGIYFQAMAICVVYLTTILVDSDSFIKCAIIVSALQIIGNFNPFIKMDGYWMLCDLLGVSNPYNIIWGGIKNLFKREKSKTEFGYMKLSIKCAFVAYAVFIITYFVYLIRLMFMLFANAIIQMSRDIGNIGVLRDMDIGFGNILSFLQARITSYLVLFFMIRLMVMLIKKIFVFRSKDENNIRVRKGRKKRNPRLQN